MPVYGVTLNESERIALAYACELLNAQHPERPPATGADVLGLQLTGYLEAILARLDGQIQPWLGLLRAVLVASPAALDVVLNVLESPATVQRIKQHLGILDDEAMT